MRALLFDGEKKTLELSEVPRPSLSDLNQDVIVKVEACAVCRTDLHVVDGELTAPKLPVIPGHQVVGRVIESTGKFKVGERLGLAWLASTCGKCKFCLVGRENLCDNALFNGYTRDGGFAEYIGADSRFCYSLDDSLDAAQFAPLLCGGLIGYRSYKFCRESLGKTGHLGIYGFGSAAHIILQVAKNEGHIVSAFVRPGDEAARAFALDMGADWAGYSGERPDLLDAAIIFAPAGELVPTALKALNKGGLLVLGGIHMSDIPSFPYDILWGERSIKSVANLTREDAGEFFELISQGGKLNKIQVKTRVEKRRLDLAEQALDDLRAGRVQGSLVIVP